MNYNNGHPFLLSLILFKLKVLMLHFNIILTIENLIIIKGITRVLIFNHKLKIFKNLKF